jgi:hypothetical protein
LYCCGGIFFYIEDIVLIKNSDDEISLQISLKRVLTDLVVVVVVAVGPAKEFC